MSSDKNEQGEQIDLTKLNLHQLQQLKTEFEQELNMFQESLQTLQKCKGKYANSREVLDSISPDWKDKQILVPLTSSMYVPGLIKEVDNFIIDIGTGYYIERDLDTSRDYFKRKVDYVQEQVEKIEKIQQTKSRFLAAVCEVMELHQQQAIQQMKQQQGLA